MNSELLLKINGFFKKRLIELFGTMLILISIFLFISIISYSPSDPNFIYIPENTTINNLLGAKGSFVSDFLLQAIGLISFLFVTNFLVWGLKLIINKFDSRL